MLILEHSFNKGFGKALGLDVESGEKMPLSGIGGRKPENIAYFHKLELVIFTNKKQRLKDAIKVTTKVGFLEREIGRAGVLGEAGFFDRFKVEFNLPEHYFELETVFEAG